MTAWLLIVSIHGRMYFQTFEARGRDKNTDIGPGNRQHAAACPADAAGGPQAAQSRGNGA
jgi:hypothetical protein